MTDDLRARLAECFSAVFPELGEDEIPLASQASVAAWDSLGAVRLLSVIEEAFNISVEPGEQEELLSFDLALDYLRSRTDVS